MLYTEGGSARCHPQGLREPKHSSSAIRTMASASRSVSRRSRAMALRTADSGRSRSEALKQSAYYNLAPPESRAQDCGETEPL